MRMVIADPTVPLDVAGEVCIAGENHFFELGFLSDATAAPLSFSGQRSAVFNAPINCSISQSLVVS